MTEFIPERTGKEKSANARITKADDFVSLDLTDPGETSPCNVCPKRYGCTRFRDCKPWRAWAAVSWNNVSAVLKRDRPNEKRTAVFRGRR